MLTYEEKMLGKIMHIPEKDIDLKKMLELMEAHKKYPKEYQSFRKMKNRATNKHSPKYWQGYGERGICEEWVAPYGFLDFIEEVGPMPDYEMNGKVSKWSIDRIDNTVGYFKGNCRWATAEQQVRNRSNTRWVNTEDGRIPLAEALEKYNIPEPVFSARIRYGWAVDRALKTPVASRKKRNNNGKIKMNQPIDPTTKKPYAFGINRYAVKGDRLELIGVVQWT